MPVPKRKVEDDERPRSGRKPPSRYNDDEEEQPTRRRGRVDDDYEDDAPPRRRGRNNDDDDQEERRPPSRGGRAASKREDDEDGEAGTTGYGWDAVANRKTFVDKNGYGGDDLKPIYNQMKFSFNLKDGESAVIQFISDQPYCADGFIMSNLNYAFYPSQRSVQRHDTYAEAGYKSQWRAGFKILDFRRWDKKKSCNVDCDDPTEKYWVAGYGLAEQIKAFADKKGRKLSEMTILVTRSGSGTGSKYNFELALDDRDRPIKPIEWDEELPTLKKVFQPLSDEDAEKVIKADRRPSSKATGGGRGGNTGRGRRHEDDDNDYRNYGREDAPF